MDVHRRTRGWSRERTPHQRPHRHTRSEPRTTTAPSKSPSPRLRCKSSDFSGGNGNNHHPSPSPPKVRANQSQLDDQAMTPPPTTSPIWKPDAQPDGASLNNSSSEPLTAAAPFSCSSELQVLPDSDPGITTQQRSHLAAERRFRTGRVYSRRPSAPPHRLQAQPAGSAQVVRFRPGLVYYRRCAHGQATICSRRQRMANGL